VRVALAFALALLAACASPADLADPGRAGLWGYLSLVPREGAGGGGGGYGDRLLRDVELVDYTRPGFAVVYAEGGPPAAASLPLEVRGGIAGVRLEPSEAALRVGAEVTVTNRDGAGHVVSCPAAGLLRHLEPGAALRFRVDAPGELSCFVPDAAETGARLCAAPGPFAVVDDAGRYELMELAPGPRRLHAWHPRFPPRSLDVELAPGEVLRLDLELGVGLGGARAR
jgi:hypothetical protein